MKPTRVEKSLVAMLGAPLKLRRNPPTPPASQEHYQIPDLAASPESARIKAVDVPVAQTPEGRWKQWPPPVLADCDDP